MTLRKVCSGFSSQSRFFFLIICDLLLFRKQNGWDFFFLKKIYSKIHETAGIFNSGSQIPLFGPVTVTLLLYIVIPSLWTPEKNWHVTCNNKIMATLNLNKYSVFNFCVIYSLYREEQTINIWHRHIKSYAWLSERQNSCQHWFFDHFL